MLPCMLSGGAGGTCCNFTFISGSDRDLRNYVADGGL